MRHGEGNIRHDRRHDASDAAARAPDEEFAEVCRELRMSLSLLAGGLALLGDGSDLARDERCQLLARVWQRLDTLSMCRVVDVGSGEEAQRGRHEQVDHIRSPDRDHSGEHRR